VSQYLNAGKRNPAEETEPTCSMINFSAHAKKRRYLSRRVSIIGLIGRRRPLTVVITFNRLAICAARVSTADRTKLKTSSRPGNAVRLTITFKREILFVTRYYWEYKETMTLRTSGIILELSAHVPSGMKCINAQKYAHFYSILSLSLSLSLNNTSFREYRLIADRIVSSSNVRP